MPCVTSTEKCSREGNDDLGKMRMCLHAVLAPLSSVPSPPIFKLWSSWIHNEDSHKARGLEAL